MYGTDIIERVNKFKYLGVIFDPLLAWVNMWILLYFLLLSQKRIAAVRTLQI